MKIHEVIKNKRKALGLTQKEVAEKIYVKHNTYSQYENGKRNIEAEILIQIANVLKIDLSTLQSKEVRSRNVSKLETDDYLTGLTKRVVFMENVQNKIKDDCQYCLYLMDIDNFKEFNNHYGHERGDEILREVGRILLRSVQKEYAGRLGGEEFAVLIDKKEETIMRNLFERLNDVHPFVYVKMTSVYFQQEDNFQKVYERADKLMRSKKRKPLN